MLYKYDGKSYRETELQKIAKKEFGVEISIQALDIRLKRGWSVVRAISSQPRQRMKQTPQRLKIQQKRANDKYKSKHPQKRRLWQYRSDTRSYIKKYATFTELEELEKLIKGKLRALKIDDFNE